MHCISRLVLAGFALLSLCAFTSKPKPAGILIQPAAERAAQDTLPKSRDAMWATLTKTKIHVDEKKGLFSATYPDEVKALIGKEVTITGFMLPLESSEKFKHFILSKRTPTCPFCPPGEPNEIIDIWMEKSIGWSEEIIKVSGIFTLMNNRGLGMFFKLTQAKILD